MKCRVREKHGLRLLKVYRTDSLYSINNWQKETFDSWTFSKNMKCCQTHENNGFCPQIRNLFICLCVCFFMSFYYIRKQNIYIMDYLTKSAECLRYYEYSHHTSQCMVISVHGRHVQFPESTKLMLAGCWSLPIQG